MKTRKCYYDVGGIEAIDFIKAKLGKKEWKGFLRGNVIKYVARAPYKGDEPHDYKKAEYYVRLLTQIK